ncbi:hypothetical protein BCR39DRAFT_485074 [Naematelia encephala]|uniref:GST N-terminal domain-containing protein n=1 Tax=Naematelia encephala TaxID=71784 RepID=A0A1Y2AUD4_9TREE|nr:hypothetical protein BCR39DRAFT_485074 [Naematelia encephala]
MTSPNITLYLLRDVPGMPLYFPPHPWKTILALKLLDVPHEVEYVSLDELSHVLPLRMGTAKVVLPALKIAHNNQSEEYIMDSYNIAIWLEENFATRERSLFSPGSHYLSSAVVSARIFARFLENWVDHSLAAALRPCIKSFVSNGSDLLTGTHRDSYRARVGVDVIDEMAKLNKDPTWREAQYERAREQFNLLERLLAEQSERGEIGDFITGSEPRYVDIVFFAFYPFSLPNPSLVLGTWRHSSLPFVGKWLDAMLGSGLIDTGALPADPSK